MTDSSARECLAVAGLLFLFVTQSIGGMADLSATFDETTHLPAGYSYLVTGEVRLNPQHPPLAKTLAALPLLLLPLRVDLVGNEFASQPPEEREFGRQFLYSNDADRLLFWGRIPIVALSVLLGFYTWRWARDLFGPASGLLALFLYAFCPNLIAHSHLVTTDAPLTTFFVMTLYHAWRWMRFGRRLHLVAAGIALGLALGTKFSGIVLVPVLAILFFVPDGSAGRGFRRGSIGIIATGTLAFVTLQAVYFLPSDPLLYFRNLGTLYADKNPAFDYYLLGGFRKDGWWSYFLVAAMFKTPLPVLLAFLVGVLVFFRERSAAVSDEAFLILPAVAFTAATSAFAHNIGIRYLLPVYPLAFVFASRVASRLQRSRWWCGAAFVLAAWHVAGAVRIFPHHLSYFNELCGGPSRGYEVLDDSNIDWGQDLERLAEWLRANNVRDPYLSYFGTAPPEYYGIRYRPVADQDLRDRPRPGVYAMSVHTLIRGRLWARRDGWRSDWLDRYEPIGRVGYSIFVYRFE